MSEAQRATRARALRSAVIATVVLVAVLSAATMASASIAGMQRASVLGASVQIPGTNSLPSVSGDGRYVAFESDATMSVSAWAYANGPSIYLRDRTTGAVALISGGVGARANGPSHAPVVSADGHYVVFTSRASNLITTTDTITNAGVYRYSIDRKTVERVDSLADAPVAWSSNLAKYSTDWWYTAVSETGRFVAYAAPVAVGSPLLQVHVRDMDTGTITLVSVDGAGRAGALPASHPAMSLDGTRIAFSTSAPLDPSDTNGRADVYLRDVVAASTSLVSVPVTTTTPAGASDWPSLDGAGTTVAFVSDAENLTTVPITPTVDRSTPRNVFVRDLAQGVTHVVSMSATATARGACFNPALSRDGRYVGFQSSADNLKPVGTQYPYYALFVYDRLAGRMSAVASQALQPDDSASSIGFTADSRYVVFSSLASDLVSGDTNGTRDVFFYEFKYKATPTLSTPKLSTSYVRRNRYVTVSGTVTKHAGAKGVVKLMIYKRRSGSDYYKSYTVYTAVNGTKWTKRLALPSTGKWYVRAVHYECDTFKTAYSPYRYFTVYR